MDAGFEAVGWRTWGGSGSAWPGATLAALALHLVAASVIAQALAPPSQRSVVGGPPGGAPAPVVRLRLAAQAVPPEPALADAVRAPQQTARAATVSGTDPVVTPGRQPDPSAGAPRRDGRDLAEPADRPPPIPRAAGAPEATIQPGPDAAPAAALRPPTSDDDAVEPPTLPAEVPGAEQLRALPRYAVRLPPPFEVAVRARRGTERADGRWRFEHPPEGGYRLRLDLQVRGRPWLVLDSEGRPSPDGLQPLRHEDHRRGRRSAVNFDPAAGMARFSGSPLAVPTADAVQDRLSWVVQLAGVLAAQPALGCAGAQVWLHVVGVRGGSAVWRFDAQGLVDDETVDAPGPRAGALWHFARQPTQPYDQRVEVWLTRDAPHWPRRLRWTPVPAGPGWDLQLASPDAATATAAPGPANPCRTTPAAARQPAVP